MKTGGIRLNVDSPVRSLMTRYDWEKIQITGQRITDLQQKELTENPTVINALNNYQAALYIDGRDVFGCLVSVYLRAEENILCETVLHFLRSLEDTEVLKALVNSVFLTIAAEQKKKTDFKAVIKEELRSREKRLKELEREQKRLEFENMIADKPSYYGKPLTQAVVEQILSDEGIAIRLNLLSKKPEFSGHGAETVFRRYSRENIVETYPKLIKDICTANEVQDCYLSAIEGYLFNIADSNRYHPIRAMLKAHQNSDVSHLEKVYDILKLTDDFEKTLVRKWMVQTVAFAFASMEHPVSAEGVLVLQGAQGIAKTSFFRILSGNPRWFAEGAVIDMRNKDSIINAISAWICELGEIDSTLKKEQSALKAFITRTMDNIRMPYGRSFSDLPRTTSFCGTVNPDQFLKDTTGNRRYWTIHVDSIDRSKLFSLTQEEVFDIWGCVYSLYLDNPQGFRLNDVEAQRLELRNRDFSTELPYEGEVKSLLDYQVPKEHWKWVTPAELSALISGARAEHIGRVLSRIQKEIPGTEKRRTKTGYSYRLPLSGWTAGVIRNNPSINGSGCM